MRERVLRRYLGFCAVASVSRLGENGEALEKGEWQAGRSKLSCVALHERPPTLPLLRIRAPGTLGDPHLGPVCSDCYAVLTATRVTLEKIGPLVGIGACSSEVNH